MTVKHRDYFFLALGFLLIAAVAINYIPIITAAILVIFTLSLWSYKYFSKRNSRIGIYLSWFCAIILGIVVGLYRPHGFNYPLVFGVERLYEGGLPFTLYANIAKFFAGIIIVYFLLSSKSVSSAYIKSPFKQFLLVTVVAFCVLGAACEIIGLAFHTKLLKYIVLFGLVNLIITCLAEEAFMRLLLQEQIQRFISGTVAHKFWQESIPLVITTFIFVLTHAVHDFNAVVVFAIAGFSYGLVYSLTKNLWACVAVHCTVNIIHFSFLTYPLY